MKRLKKDCPCSKCERWRREREIGKIHKAMSEAFTRMLNSAPPGFRTPIIDSIPDNSAATVMIGRSTSEPQPQSIPRTSDPSFGPIIIAHGPKKTLDDNF